MTSESSQQVTGVLVPDFDGPVIRTTGKHAIRVEGHSRTFSIMTSETSQLIARVLVPKFDCVVTGTAGEQISGVECNRLELDKFLLYLIQIFIFS